MLEDSRGRLWLGCQPGLSVRLPDGSSFLFDTDDLKGIQVVDFAEGSNGSIWVATRNMGILRIDGSGTSAGSYSGTIMTPIREMPTHLMLPRSIMMRQDVCGWEATEWG